MLKSVAWIKNRMKLKPHPQLQPLGRTVSISFQWKWSPSWTASGVNYLCGQQTLSKVCVFFFSFLDGQSWKWTVFSVQVQSRSSSFKLHMSSDSSREEHTSVINSECTDLTEVLYNNTDVSVKQSASSRCAVYDMELSGWRHQQHHGNRLMGKESLPNIIHIQKQS